MSLQVEEGNYTWIVNEVLEKLALFPFPAKTGMPIRLALFVIRKTWGYQKKEDYISLTQFENALVSNRPSVVHWLEYLVKANILVKGSSLPTKGTLYRFNKYHEQWRWGVKATQLVKARKTGWLKQATKGSNVAVTHKRKKEIYTKENRADKPLKDKFETNKYPKEDYKQVLDNYQRIKNLKLQGDEFLPPMAEIKRMFKSARTVKQIIETMEICEDNYEDWSMNTVRMKIADVVGGKLISKNPQKNTGIVAQGVRDIWP